MLAYPADTFSIEFQTIIYQTNFNDRTHKKLMWRGKIDRGKKDRHRIDEISLSQCMGEEEILNKNAQIKL